MKKRPSFLPGASHPGGHDSNLNLSSANKQIRRASTTVEGSNLAASSVRRSSSIAYTKNPRQAHPDPRPITDRNFQTSAIRTLNAFFQSHGSPLAIPLKGLPSGKDVKEIIHFLFRSLDPELPLGKLEDDVPFFFKQLGYPFQINKSALYAAGSPHSWPALLAGLVWLVQLARYRETIEEEPLWFAKDQTFEYVAESYECYLRGDDASVEALDNEFMLQMEEERAVLVQNTAAAETLVRDLEVKVQGSKPGVALVEGLENDKVVLAKDVAKFHSIIGNFRAKKEALERVLGERRRELEVKGEEVDRMGQENEGLKKQVDVQQVNVRDFEKMSRELHSVEEDVRAAEEARSQWDEKAWGLEVSVSKKLKELEGLVNRYNQEITRLKLGSAYEVKLNSRGATPTEILGVDFKVTIKPGIISCTEDYEKSSRENWEESIAVLQQLHDKISEQERKRNINGSLAAKAKKLESRYNSIKNSMEEYVASKVEERGRLTRELQKNERDMKLKDIEADEYLKKAMSELEDMTRHYDEEIKLCSNELFRFIDMIAKHKEHVESSIFTVKKSMNKTVEEIKSTYDIKGKINANIMA